MSREYRFMCELCHRLPARFVCRLCGRRVCINCYDPYSELCIECSRREAEREAYPRISERVAAVPPEPDIGVKLFMAGFLMSFVGAIVMMLSSLLGGGGSGGFVVWVWPLPPIFSAWGPHSQLVLFILAVATLAGLAYIALRYLLPRR